jgi:hypothetical protein
MSESISVTTVRTCGTCGESFEAMSATFEIGGTPITIAGQLHCDHCVTVYDRNLEKTSRQSTIPARPEWKEICPPCYFDFQRDLLPPGAQSVYEELMTWKAGSKGIGLIGDSREGKTFLMYELFRRWYDHGKSVCITTSTEFAWACGSVDQHDRRELLKRMIKADMTLIDDLGKEKITDRVESDLYHVFEQRRRYQRPLFVTVNSTGDELASRMSGDGGIPIINRLKEDLCEFIAIG